MNWFREPVEDEVSYDEILEKANNGEFHKWNFEPFMAQESGYEDVLEELKKYQAVDYLAYETEYKKLMKEGKEAEAQEYKAKMDAMVEDVLKIYRSKNIFPIQYFSDYGALDEIQKCIAYNAKFDGNTVSCVSGDTMYFNGTEWKHIRDYTDWERVLQFNEDGTATLVKPEKYIHYQSEEPFYEYNSTVLSSAQTGSHDVVYWTKDGGYQKVSQENIKINEDYMIPITCIAEGGRVLSESILNAFVENGIIPEDIESLLLNKENRLYVLRKLFPEFKKHRRRLVVKTAGVAQCLHTMLIFSGERATVATGRGYEVVWNSLNTYKKDEDITKLGSGKYFGKYDDLSKGVREFRKIPASRSGFKDKYCFVVPSHMLVLMRHSRVYITGNCGAGIGTGLCRWLFPNIFDTPSAHDLNKKDAETQYKKFLNDTYLRRAIKFCYSYKNGCPTPTAVEGGLRLVGSAPSNFRPMNAKAVYERFCPKGGVIYDYCCGFGGRMLGALSSKNNYKYVGTDPCTETMYHLHQLGEYIEQVTGREDSYELHCCGSEEFKGPANSIDFAFSSPPYFNLEVYSDEPTQCFNKFPELNQWLEGFVRPTIQNIKHMLKPGKFYAVNIADFKVGSGQVVAYVDEWIRISTEEGMPLFDTVYLGVTARAGSAEQAAGELKKENILVFKKPLW